MSMIGNYLAITEFTLKSIIKDPEYVVDYIDKVKRLSVDDQSRVQEKGLLSSIHRLVFGVNITPTKDFAGISRILDVDKSWHAIQYLVNGTAEAGDYPLSQVVMGGKEIGPDMGYGPVRYLEPKEVQDVASSINRFTDIELKKAYDPKVMDQNGIYPECWEEWAEDGDDGFEYVNDKFKELKQYYNQASKDKKAMLLWID